jgi:hypothetical protein
MSTEAELVKQIAARGFAEAKDLVGCVVISREGDYYMLQRAIASTKAARAANIVQKALLQRVLMTVERAFAPHSRKSDRHARVAIELLSNPTIFDEVASAGSRRFLKEACAIWRTYDTDVRRKKLKHFRDKVVAHTAERDPAVPAPLVTELRNYAMGTAHVLGRLAQGSGVVGSDAGLETLAYDESAKAFWDVWR